jgi:hypothetical protein
LNTDGVTLVPIKIDPATGGMFMDTMSTISFTMTPIGPGDENFNKVLLWEGTDGKTYPWVVNSNGAVLATAV